MIKKIKYILWSLLLLIWIINFSSAWYTRQVWTYWYNPYFNWYDVNLSNRWNPLTQNLWYTKQLFVISDRVFWWWSSNWLPYFYANSPYWNWLVQWNPWKYYVCDEIIDSSSESMPLNCMANLVGEDTSSIFWNFLSTLKNSDYFYFDYYTAWWYNSYFNYTFCISNHSVWSSLCFNDNQTNWDHSNTYTWNMWYTNLSFDNINASILKNPPSSLWGWTINIWTWWIELSSSDSAVNYFENNYWFNQNICYIWVNDMTTMWWSSVSFSQWNWLNIFEAYKQLYWNSDLDKVYVWINSRLINYEQWYQTSWNPRFLSTYNSWTNQVDLYYNNLTFPFANNPVWVYFMASNIINFKEKTIYYDDIDWSAVVDYCNIILQDWSFDDILSDAVKENINKSTEQENINKWLNPDWTVKYSYVPKNYTWFMDYSWSDVFVSWIGGEYTWDISDFFDRAISSFESILNKVDHSVTWMLPNWFIFAFLLVVLFKILRKY